MTDSPALAVGDGQIERIVGRGTLATVTDHRHDPRAGRHRDPGEEVFDGPSIVFSEGESWSFRTAAGSVEVDGRVALLVEAGQGYQARHERSWPEDRSTTIRFDTDAVAALLASDVALGDSRASARLFASWWLPRTPAIEAIQMDITEAASRAGGPAIDEAAITLLGIVGSPELVGRVPGGGDARDGRDRVVEGAAWLRANLADDVSLADLARVTSTSPFHLSRLFRRHLGLPPFAYLRHIRLGRAAELLRDGDLRVTEVCYAVGFGSLSHFVTSFRTTYGVSPGAYRRGRRAA